MSIQREQLYIQYLELGESRTLAKLAQLTGYKLNTLNKYSQVHNWQERILKDTIELNRHIIEDSNLDISGLTGYELLSRISRDSQEKLYKAIKTVKVSSARDAKVLLELSQLAAGKPTEIQQTISNDDNLISVSILLDIIEMLPREWQDKANAELEKRISSTIDNNSENNPQQYYN